MQIVIFLKPWSVGVYSMIMLFYSIKRKVIYNVKRTWVYGKIKVTENELDELMAVIQEVWPEVLCRSLVKTSGLHAENLSVKNRFKKN